MLKEFDRERNLKSLYDRAELVKRYAIVDGCLWYVDLYPSMGSKAIQVVQMSQFV